LDSTDLEEQDSTKVEDTKELAEKKKHFQKKITHGKSDP